MINAVLWVILTVIPIFVGAGCLLTHKGAQSSD